MSDIRLATDFFDHPKNVMLQADHGPEATIALLRLWCWAATNRSKGLLRGLDKKRIAAVSRCSIDMVEAMIKEGFIDESSRGFKLHNWKKNQPYAYYGEERSTQARKAAKARYSVKSKKKVTCTQHADSIAPSPDPVPSPNPSPKKIKNVPPEALRLAGILSELILNNNPENRECRSGKREASEKRWAGEIDKMQRIDGRAWESIEKCIRWSQRDDFWRSNILSGSTLRKQYDKMSMAAKGNGGMKENAADQGRERMRRHHEQERSDDTHHGIAGLLPEPPDE